MKRAVTLKENYEFRRMYQKGASAVDRCMVVYCRKNKLGRNRYGFTVSVKLGGAVVRNRARRRLREVCHNKASLVGGKITVSHINSDALLTLCHQSVQKQGIVDGAAAASHLAV